MLPKGRELELQLENAMRQLNMLPGVLAVRLETRQAKIRGEMRYVGQQPCDYLIVTPKYTWGLDAKECCAEKWYPAQAPAHQIEALQKLIAMGHRGGFVVHFLRYRGMPGAIRYITDFSRPATVHDGAMFDWEMFL